MNLKWSEGRSEMQRVGQSARGNITIPSFLMRSEARANETYTVNVGSSTTQNQGDAVRGIDHLPMVEALRPVPVLERMGATVINATGDVVLPSLPDAEAVAAGETKPSTTLTAILATPSCNQSVSECAWICHVS